MEMLTSGAPDAGRLDYLTETQGRCHQGTAAANGRHSVLIGGQLSRERGAALARYCTSTGDKRSASLARAFRRTGIAASKRREQFRLARPSAFEDRCHPAPRNAWTVRLVFARRSYRGWCEGTPLAASHRFRQRGCCPSWRRIRQMTRRFCIGSVIFLSLK
jgi:hypothetical protein